MSTRRERTHWLPAEVERARAEDPEFAEVMGRARAKARGVPYDPAVHHPDVVWTDFDGRVSREHLEKMYALIDAWTERGRPYYRHAS